MCRDKEAKNNTRYLGQRNAHIEDSARASFVTTTPDGQSLPLFASSWTTYRCSGELS